MKRTITKTLAGIFAVMVSINFTNAQTTHDVTASGMSFSPANVTINVGDTVRWTNTSGTHNVNATTATFPSNPESFGNSLGTGWVFKHKFTIAGTYLYHCDQHFGSGMSGSVTVIDPTAGIANINNSENTIKVYPIPASKELTVELGNYDGSSLNIIIYDLNGKEVLKLENISTNKVILNTSKLQNSTYLMSILSDNKLIETRKISLNN